MMHRSTGKRVFVTGSGRGIGADVARQFALEGARVFLTARGEGEPSDAAVLVAFLASEEATWIHGAVIDVDMADRTKEFDA